MKFYISRNMRTSISLIILAAVAIFGVGATAEAGTSNPKNFVEPTAVPTFGPNNFITTFDEFDDIAGWGSEDRTGTTNLWAVGAAGTTKQEYTDLYARRDNDPTPRATNPDLTTGFITDGNPIATTPKFKAHAPGYITGSGNMYSFAGEYGADVVVPNYGGPTGSLSGGTLVVMQTAASLNPDYRPVANVGLFPAGTPASDIDPGQLRITKGDGSALGTAAEVLSFGTLLQSDSVNSAFGPVSWQELLWTIWVPDYTGDLKIDFDIPVHTMFSSLRLDTAIGTMSGDVSLANFTAVPEPSSLVLLASAGLGGVLLMRRRLARK